MYIYVLACLLICICIYFVDAIEYGQHGMAFILAYPVCCFSTC